MKNNGNNKSSTNTDWSSASSWFSEKQNGRINTSAGRYDTGSRAPKNERSESVYPERHRETTAKTGSNTKGAGKATQKKKKAVEIRPLPSFQKKQSVSKSKDELRLEHAEKTRKRRKRRIIEWFIFTALIFAVIFVVASLTVLFHIEEIGVEGESRYSQEQIIEASGVKNGDNLWRTMTGDVSENVSTALPYIGRVKLSRKIPSRLILVVEETAPEYALRSSKAYTLVDAYGKVLELGVKKSGGCIIVDNLSLSEAQPGKRLVAENPESYDIIKDIVECADKNGIKITEINTGDTNNICALCSEKLRLDFGSATQLSEKMKMANEVISKLREEDSLNEGTINLKSTTKAFYKEGSASLTGPVKSEKKKSGKNKSKNAEEVTDKAKEAETQAPASGKTVSGENIPEPPSERPQ